MLTQLLIGNAARDGSAKRGWFVGHFMPAGLPRTDDLEIKWGIHALHEGRTRWSKNVQASTMSVLVRGRFRLFFRETEALLAEPGDYALWGAGVEHRWRSEADDTVVLTVRWPSRAGDAVEL